MTPRPAIELIWAYWDACRKRGEVPRPVLGVVALAGAGQPVGTIGAWGLLRSYVDNRHAAMPDPDKWEIQEFLP
jgi:hypothetical protein